MNGRVCGVLVQFGCYQHGYEWKGLWCSIVQFGCYQHGYEWKGAWVCGVLVQFSCFQHRRIK